MILAQPNPHFLLPAGVPTWLIALAAVLAIAAWVAMHRILPRYVGDRHRYARAVGRVAVGFLAAMLVIQWLHRTLTLTTNWPLWPIALGAGGGVELLLWFYALERCTVSRRVGLALAAMRVALLLIVLGILTQPVHSFTLRDTTDRYVAVLIDESASMRLADPQRSPSAKLRLARAMDVDVPERPYAMDTVRDELDTIADRLAVVGERIALLGNLKRSQREKQLADAREDLLETVEGILGRAKKLPARVQAPLDGSEKLPDKLRARLGDLKGRVTVHVRDRLAEAVRILEDDDEKRMAARLDRLKKILRSATSAAIEAAPLATTIGKTLDERFLKSLPEKTRNAIDAVCERSRAQLARDVLFHQPAGEGKSLRDALSEEYTLKAIRFAARPSDAQLSSLARSYGTSEGLQATTSPASLDPNYQATDLSAAMGEVLASMPKGRLSGVVLLTDGRHTGTEDPLATARRIGRRGAPVCSVVLGADRPPIDAAITQVDAPETVFLEDEVHVQAEVKFTGLGGREVNVSLRRDGKTVDEQTVRVPAGSDDYRREIRFSHEPDKQGLRQYVVHMDAADDEITAENNEYPVTISVTRDRVHVLLIEGRPRWEFRYIKNLFADRDKSVKLQYVLVNPDAVQGRTRRPKVHASVTAKDGQVEATVLPKNEEEWLKFDVIVLGDVNPSVLTDEHRAIIEKFVTSRGGTLVAIAGQYHLPHAYHETKLADLLPVTFPGEKELADARRKREDERNGEDGNRKKSKDTRGASMGVPSGDKVYRLALTEEGLRSVVMSQAVKPEKNREIWGSIPELYWRYPITEAKEAATVLAWARPGERKGGRLVFSEEPWNRPRPGREKLPVTTSIAKIGQSKEKELERRLKFQREHALVVQQQVAMGRVLFLGFDRTWRFRYRIGDTYHHKFWGQVIRWATADKLSGGITHVRIGTDRTRYQPGRDVTVRAKLLDEKFNPISSEDVHAVVYRGDEVLLRRRLAAREGSLGLYEGNLGELDGGSYRVKLEAPAAKRMLARKGLKTVSTQFSVDPAVPAEQLELGATRELVSQLAAISGGAVFDVADAGDLVERLGEPSEVYEDHRQVVLWDSWPLLILVVALATAEWITRKKVGLP
jgi:hypothetical protein